MLTVLCEPPKRRELESILFRETGTLGIRRLMVERTKLPRQSHAVQTPWGSVDGKLATLPDGGRSFAPEYESCRAVARANGIPVRDVYQAAQAAWRQVIGLGTE